MREHDSFYNLQESEHFRNFIAEPHIEHRKLAHPHGLIYLDRQYVREKLRELVKLLKGSSEKHPQEEGDFIG